MSENSPSTPVEIYRRYGTGWKFNRPENKDYRIKLAGETDKIEGKELPGIQEKTAQEIKNGEATPLQKLAAQITEAGSKNR